jgi:hypothetical protein
MLQRALKPSEPPPKNQVDPKNKGKKHRRFIKRSHWKKIQDKKKLTPITPIYNYSKIELTKAMTKFMSRGLNFCINPKKFNMTELLVDVRKFERKLKWKEFFTDDDDTQINEWTPEIFPKEKNNLPAKSSKGLNNFITGIRGELRGTELNKVRPNLPGEEEEAIQTLILLQKSQEIIIKLWDKGAVIIICGFIETKMQL